MQRDPRYDDVVDEVKAFLEERLRVRGRRGHRRASASCSTRASASARPSSTTSSCCARLDELADARAADRDRHLAQVLPRAHRRDARASEPSDVAARLPGRSPPTCSALERGAQRVPRPRRRAGARRARGRGCYVGRAMDGEAERRRPDELDDDGDDDDDDEREEAAEPVTIEITGLSLYTHHGVSEAEREVGQRLVFDLRLDVGESDATVTDSDRGHRRLRRGLPARRAGRPAALAQDARAPVQRDRRPAARRLRAGGVWVKAAKPEPPIPLAVEEVSVEVWREAGERP